MKELINIQFKLVSKKGQRNNFGKYAFRSAEDILESVKPLLKEENCILTLNDDLVVVGDRYYIKTIATITNSDGISISSTAFAREALEQRGMSDGQITGATSSYARKYALNGLLAIAENDDLDSHENEPVKSPPPSKATDADKKRAWSDFTNICINAGVEATNFLSENVDMSDRNAVYAEVRKWLKNEELLRNQLLVFKQGN